MKPVPPFGLSLGAVAVLAFGAVGQAQTTPAQTTPVQPAPAAPTPRPLYSAASYIALGNAYYGKGQYDSAYVAFRAATESDPRSLDALLGLGRSQTRLRLYGPAVETLQQLLALDSRNLSGYVALAQAYVAQYVGVSDRAAVAGNLDLALRALEDGAAVDPTSAVLFNERSIIYKLKGDYKSAIATSQKAAQLNPDDSVILYNLGDLYFASGNLPLALATMQKAVIADPTDAQSRAYYGRLLLQMNRPDDAKLELAQAERIAPDNAYVVGQYGVYGYLTGNAALARIKLSQALKLDPLRYPEFYFYLGRLEFDAGTLAAARADFTKAAALASGNADYFYWLGRAQEAGGDKLAARDAYTQAVALNPALKTAQDALSRVK